MTGSLVSLIREYAQDHYYRESWDLVAARWTDDDIAAAIRGAKTRRGAIAKAWGKLQVIDRARPRWQRPAKPLSLLEFIAGSNGIRSDDRMIGDLRQIIGTRNLLVPRFGWLIRQPRHISTAARMGGGRAPMFLDGAREAAVEAGYLCETRYQDGEAISTIVDLLDAIDDETRGAPRYPMGEAPFEPADFSGHQEEESDDAIPF